MLSLAGPADRVVTSHVDRVDHHHLVDKRGCVTLEQWIFWRWEETPQFQLAGEGGRYDCVGWRLANDVQQLHVTRNGSRWLIEFYDARSKCKRRIVCNSFSEYSCNWDPEIRARRDLPPDQRQGL